jgi:hypothetical protein
VRGSEFTTKAASPQRDSEEFVPSSCAVALDSNFARARVFVHEVSRAEELAERRRARAASIAPGSSSKSTARGRVLAARDLVVKHVDAAELCVVVAAVLAVTVDGRSYDRKCGSTSRLPWLLML